MSATVTIGSDTATIYGTEAAAASYLAFSIGDQYTAWRALSATDSSRSLVTATRFLDRLAWLDAYDTFAERDAVTAIQQACYELAALIAEDPEVLTGGGGDVASYSGGGVSVTFAGAGKRRSPLPLDIRRMIGKYLSAPSTMGGTGQTGDDTSAFSEDENILRSGSF